MNLKVPVALRYGIRGKYYFYSIDTKFRFPILNISPNLYTNQNFRVRVRLTTMAAAMRFSVVRMLVTDARGQMRNLPSSRSGEIIVSMICTALLRFRQIYRNGIFT